MTETKARVHDFDQNKSSFGRWTCRRCGASTSWYESGRDMEGESSWDCDVEVVRTVMES